MTTTKQVLKIGTRGSTLAMWQANHVKALLTDVAADLTVEIVPIKTKGDVIQDVALARLEGKAFFTKEIEDALLAEQVDLAVHSGKDVPTEQPSGLVIAGFLKRHSPLDAWISRNGERLETIAGGATVGTSSLRRRALIASLRPDLVLADLRGNVDTRLRKLGDGLYDAIVLAAAGLERLGLTDRITALLPAEAFPPAVTQGAIAVETRRDDRRTNRVVAAIVDSETSAAALAERALLQTLEGGCQVPLGALARIDGDTLTLTASLVSLDGTKRIDRTIRGNLGNGVALGRALAEAILNDGGDTILAEIRGKTPA